MLAAQQQQQQQQQQPPHPLQHHPQPQAATPPTTPPPPPSSADPARALHRYLRPTRHAPSYALIVLNAPLGAVPRAAFEALWLNATWRLCADGGANRLHDLLRADPAAQRRMVPHVIAGDMDSARADVVQFYRELGARIEHIRDQDSTDLDKCLALVPAMELGLEAPLDVVVLGAGGGRFDHAMAIVHTLLRQAAAGRTVWALDAGSAITALAPGTHRIDTLDAIEPQHCGVLPIGEPATVSSWGLRWDMRHHTLRFGAPGIGISACNHIDYAATASATATAAEAPPTKAPLSSSSPPLSPQQHSAPSPCTPRARRESAPDVRPGERLAHVYVHTSAPVVWTVELDLSSVGI